MDHSVVGAARLPQNDHAKTSALPQKLIRRYAPNEFLAAPLGRAANNSTFKSYTIIPIATIYKVYIRITVLNKATENSYGLPSSNSHPYEFSGKSRCFYLFFPCEK